MEIDLPLLGNRSRDAKNPAQHKIEVHRIDIALDLDSIADLPAVLVDQRLAGDEGISLHAPRRLLGIAQLVFGKHVEDRLRIAREAGKEIFRTIVDEDSLVPIER